MLLAVILPKEGHLSFRFCQAGMALFFRLPWFLRFAWSTFALLWNHQAIGKTRPVFKDQMKKHTGKHVGPWKTTLQKYVMFNLLYFWSVPPLGWVDTFKPLFYNGYKTALKHTKTAKSVSRYIYPYSWVFL